MWAHYTSAERRPLRTQDSSCGALPVTYTGGLMAYDDSLQELLRAIRERPDGRDELRRLVLTEELLAVPERLARLEATVERLADAQVRTAEQLSGLTARVDQLAARMDDLTARMDQLAARMDELTARMDQLAARMDELTSRMDQLVEAVLRFTTRVDRLGTEVGRLSEGVGALAELEAQRSLLRVLAERGYRRLDRIRALGLDGEVDVATRVQDGTGQTFSIVLEAKFRLHRGDVTAWSRRLKQRAALQRLRLQGLQPPYLAYAFGVRVYEDAERAGRETGIGILDSEGEVVAPAPLPAA